MKTHRPVRLLALLALSAPLFAADPLPAPKESRSSTAAALGARFKQVRERIDSLFEHRLANPAPVDPRSNPFRLPGAAPVASTVRVVEKPGEPPPSLPANNLVVLQQAAATLKVNGTFEVGSRSHLVINARPYKEGDVVQTTVQGETIYVRIREISKKTRAAILVYNDAEMTLKF